MCHVSQPTWRYRCCPASTVKVHIRIKSLQWRCRFSLGNCAASAKFPVRHQVVRAIFACSGSIERSHVCLSISLPRRLLFFSSTPFPSLTNSPFLSLSLSHAHFRSTNEFWTSSARSFWTRTLKCTWPKSERWEPWLKVKICPPFRFCAPYH